MENQFTFSIKIREQGDSKINFLKKKEVWEKSVSLNAGYVCDKTYWLWDFTGLERKSGYME